MSTLCCLSCNDDNFVQAVEALFVYNAESLFFCVCIMRSHYVLCNVESLHLYDAEALFYCVWYTFNLLNVE